MLKKMFAIISCIKRMKKITVMAAALAIALLTNIGCHHDNRIAYRTYVEQPTIQTIGKISTSDLTKLASVEPETTLLFLTNSSFWTMDRESNLYQFDLATEKSSFIGNYDFGMSLDQFTGTEDGIVWGSCSRSNEDYRQTGYLMKFDEATSSFSAEKEWADTSMFIKLEGYKKSIYAFRAKVMGNGSNEYIIEKYDTKTKESKILVKKTFKNKKGTLIYSISLENNYLYALVGETNTDTHHYIVRYDLNGNEQEKYDMPEYNDAFMDVHKAPINIEVFDCFVGIKSLQTYSTIFQLQEGLAKRIYFTDNRIETDRQAIETPIHFPIIDDKGTGDSRFTFFLMGNRFVVYDQKEEAFLEIKLEIGEKYPVEINSNLDLIIQEAGDSLRDLTTYKCSLKSLLLNR